MKIAYLHQYFNTPNMQGGTRSYEMARRLVKAGHEVELITTWREPTSNTDWFVSIEEGIRVHWLPVRYQNDMGFLKRVRAFFHFAIAARKRAIKTRADLVLATSTPLTIAIPGVGASKILKVPMVFEVRDLWPEMPIATGDLRNPLLIALARWLERYAYRNSHHIIALSPGMAETICASGFPPENVTVIPNSCDLDLFQKSEGEIEQVLENCPQLHGKSIVAYCGTLGRVNRVSYLVKVAAEMSKIDDTVLFFVVGEGAEKADILSEARHLKVLGSNFFVFPGVSKRDIPRILQSCSISLSLFDDIPEMRKNSANKFFDTLAAGKPIAINYKGWHAEIIEDRHLGLVLPFSDHRAAAVSISSLLNDEGAIQAAGQNAREAAAELFDRDILAREFETVLERAGTTID